MAFGYCRCLRLSVCVRMCVCVRQSSVCPDDNLSPAQATITKFGPQVQNTLIKNKIEANRRFFTVVSVIDQCWHIKFRQAKPIWYGENQ